jgi:hypothetical protein
MSDPLQEERLIPKVCFVFCVFCLCVLLLVLFVFFKMDGRGILADHLKIVQKVVEFIKRTYFGVSFFEINEELHN